MGWVSSYSNFVLRSGIEAGVLATAGVGRGTWPPLAIFRTRQNWRMASLLKRRPRFVRSQSAIFEYGQLFKRIEVISERTASSLLAFGRLCCWNILPVNAPNRRKMPVAEPLSRPCRSGCQTLVEGLAHTC